MATEIRVPTLGESVSEATIGKWFKNVGDAIAVDEPLVELETDKVTIEVPASSAGSLAEITAKEGDTVEVGALLGMIGSGDGAAAAPAKKAEAKPEATAQASGSAAAASTKEAEAKTAEVAGEPAITERKPSEMPASPAASKILAEKGVSLSQVEGSGKRGQVLKGDVLDAVAKGITAQSAAAEASKPVAARPASSADDASREERVKMTRLRQTIARRLKDAQNTAAMLTTYNEVDMSAVMDLRNRYKEIFEKKHGVKLGFMGFFTKAVTHALKEVPSVNAEIDGNDIIYKNFAHVGVAVGTDRGLVVPVVRNADQMSIAEIEKEIGRLGKAARDGALSMADMQGGTFTISNGGVYGSLMSSPILNAPQSGILGMHKIQDRPVVVGGQIVIRPMMYLALSYDHRIVDGKEAVTFLVRVKESLEDPERLVLDL
ncbi:2-oxoglutarate dehydrogenase complex dihydrolipoyllysine-residue succinyltransferase [Phyllobacterium zundukense]|jgi:2-oxoglutarate dehydrogenase E2 component (dihydrolipoamide succinyltransferase)|uniref:2-oxoglutarate dehydrogenase complex dihydrolipoyllysine-residue succinyltransferase n=1 Tax=Phyllobacterium zundukense TaxID=1867719 RepID=A0ACD4D7P7_9HYPH|nr:2-oxoglutarate dehydrogenase complex dihydrolipoyllysine-residue succinyltransferase [Phyllobacterium zundukense]UXN61941.1 2-oxoglutarate dehydrogenase complex dihydrolipoyllysine-residue succinyltransferase [Phyllobacterium zundukense]